MKFLQQFKQHQKGFSMIELIVVIGIFGIIMGIVLFNQGKLNNNILVSNLAYEIALAVRETQSYGIGVRASGVGQTNFSGAYGLQIDFENNPNQLILFHDTINPLILDPGEEVSRYTIQNQRGNTITGLCINKKDSICQGASSERLVNIFFQRPNPDAKFAYKNIAGNILNSPGPVYIVVNTPNRDNCRVIAITQTGQISIENSDAGHCTNGN